MDRSDEDPKRVFNHQYSEGKPPLKRINLIIGEDRMKGTILLHESDSELRKVIALHLEQSDWRVLQSKTVSFAMQLLETEEPEILISECDPPHSNEGDLIDRFQEINGDVSDSILIITTLDRLDKELLRRYNPEVVIHKPFDVRMIGQKLDRAMVD